MIDDSHASSQHDALPDPGTSSDASLGGDHGVLPDPNIVSDLNQVIDFDAFSDESSSERGSVHGCVGAYLHIVLQFHDTYLGYFNSPGILYGVPKAIAANDDAGM
jgi:hypothetical protein